MSLTFFTVKNVSNLAKNEATLVHAASLNKETGPVTNAQMRHTYNKSSKTVL